MIPYKKGLDCHINQCKKRQADLTQMYTFYVINQHFFYPNYNRNVVSANFDVLIKTDNIIENGYF